MCQLLCSEVRKWLNQQKTGLSITHSKQFESLLSRIRADLGLTNYGDDEIALKIAVCILGPKIKEPPPEMMRHLYGLLADTIPGKNEWVQRAWELVVAYGCGWRRVVNKTLWGSHWVNAVVEMERLISIQIQQALRALAFGNGSVRGFNKVFPKKMEREDMARSIAMEFFTNLSNKYKLSDWVPKKGNLGSFLQFAVQGSTTESRKTLRLRITAVGLLSQSMLFEKLEEHGVELKTGKLEFKKCQETHNEKICNTVFEGESCSKCKMPFDLTKSRRIKKPLLYLPTNYGEVERKNASTISVEIIFFKNWKTALYVAASRLKGLRIY